MGTAAIRRVRAGEYEAVADLTVAVYRLGGYGSTQYEPALRDVAGRDATAQVLVAVLEDRVVGAVTVALGGGPWAERSAPGEAEVRMLVVHPDVRGAGVGASLVLACIEAARAHAVGVLRLSTEPAMTAAHRLYERLGFARTPSYDWEPVPGVPLLGYELVL
ncbi:MAG: GNAT family N-acetyltransferase [Mycobacteriales bacterium]